MKNNIKWIILSVAFCLTVGLYIINSFQKSEDLAKIEIELYKMGKELNDQLSGKPVPDIVCTDTNRDTIHLSDLVKEKKILVYYYSELHCSSCYEKQLEWLQNSFKEVPFPIVVLGAYLTYRHFSIYMKINSYKLPVYQISYNVFDWFIENSGVPFCFVLNEDMTASYFYIPNNDYPAINNRYLEGVKKLLSD
jgi:hypothetical protein